MLDLKGIGWTQARDGQLAITPDHLPRLHEPSKDALMICPGGNTVAPLGKQLAVRLMGGQAAQIDLPWTGHAPCALTHLAGRRAICCDLGLNQGLVGNLAIDSCKGMSLTRQCLSNNPI